MFTIEQALDFVSRVKTLGQKNQVIHTSDIPAPYALETALSNALADLRAESEKHNEDDGESSHGEEMDGDHESALASAGFGTDEDYGGCDERF